MDKELVFTESIGIYPPEGTLAESLLICCSFDDQNLWDEHGILNHSDEELEEAVKVLRMLGWDFYYGAWH